MPAQFHGRREDFRNESEGLAALRLQQELPEGWHILANLQIPRGSGKQLASSKRSVDCDLVVVGRRLVFLLQVKDWAGTITGNVRHWYVGKTREVRESPVPRLNEARDDLRGLIRRSLSLERIGDRARAPVHGFVVLTNPTVNISRIDDEAVPAQVLRIDTVAARLQQLDAEALEIDSIAQWREMLLDKLVRVPTRPSVPVSINQFLIVEPLHHTDDRAVDRHAQLYLARADMGQGDVYWLRVLQRHDWPHVAQEQQQTRACLREYHALRRLRPLACVQQVESSFQWWEGGYWVVPMSAPWGRHLAEDRKAGPPPATRVLAVAQRAFDELARIHSLGVLHRAIRPESLWIDDAGRPMFTDWMFAHIDGDATIWDDPILPYPLPIDSPFAAPELVGDAGKHGTWASDVYGLAATLWFWISGAAPRPGQTITPDTLPAELASQELARLLTVSLRRNAGERPEAKYVARRLARLLDPPPGQPAAIAASHATPAPVESTERTQCVPTVHAFSGHAQSLSDAQVVNQSHTPTVLAEPFHQLVLSEEPMSEPNPFSRVELVDVSTPASPAPPKPLVVTPSPASVAPASSPASPVATSLSQPTSPMMVGPYLLIRKLGTGSTGEVYEAEHTLQKRRVALKILRQQDLLPRFEREVQAGLQLSHPNVVRVHDAGQDGATRYMVMEMLSGQTLGAIVKQWGPLRPADACELVRQAALGAHHLHRHYLVHRDLKPTNLMLTPQREVKILDLGLIRFHRGPYANSDLTRLTGPVVGTLNYIAPEQFQGQSEVGVQADIYSLGCTLYYLLTGQPPFRGEPPQAQAQVTDALDRLRRLSPSVPTALAQLLGELLAIDPAERVATALVLARRLEAFTRHADLSRVIIESVEVIPDAPPTRTRGTTLDLIVHGGLACTLFVLLAGAVLLFRSPSLSADEPPGGKGNGQFRLLKSGLAER